MTKVGCETVVGVLQLDRTMKMLLADKHIHDITPVMVGTDGVGFGRFGEMVWNIYYREKAK